MKDDIAVRELSDVRQWAKDKIDAGSEPPWAWYQYMKLIETVDAILASRNASRLRLVDSVDQSPPVLPM